MRRPGTVVFFLLLSWTGARLLSAQTDSVAKPAPSDSAPSKPDTTSAAPTAAPLPVSVSGFVTASYTYATRHSGSQIVGRLYDRFHDQVELNAAKVVLEKPVATDKWSAGGAIHLLFGQNAAVIKSAGLNLGDHADLTQAFATINLPAGEGKYVQVKAGKLATLMGLEVIEDVANPNLSEGNLFIYVENFTNTGLRLDVKPGATVDFQLALINGWDVVEDNNTKKSVMGRLGLTPSASTTIGLLGFVGNEKSAVAGTTPSGDRYGGEVLLTQKAGPKATLVLQGDYGEESDALGPGLKAKWWGASLWASYDVSPALTVALRGDYVDDKNGFRTSGVLGYPANSRNKFGSGTLTFNIKRWTSALIRPELRYDRSNLAAFQDSDGGLHQDQFTFALGASYLF
jgi:Putative beta-barrel porin-2, OmpL-like. bbp2